MNGIRRFYMRLRQWVESNSTFSRSLRNAGQLLLSNVWSALIALGHGALTARILGVEQYGLLAATIAVVTMVQIVISSKVSDFTTKYLTEALDDQNTLRGGGVVCLSYSVEIVSSLVAFVVVIALAPLFARWFVQGETNVQVVRLFSVSLLANLGLETANGTLRALKRFDLLSRMTLFQSVFLLAGVIVVFVTGGQLYSVIVAYLCAYGLQTLVVQTVVGRQLSGTLGPRWFLGGFKEVRGDLGDLLAFLLHTNLGSTLSLVSKNADLLWLSLFRSATEVGYYKLAISLVNLVAVPVSSISQSFYPEIVSLVKGQQIEKLRMLLARGSLLTLLWSVAASVGVGLGSLVAIPLLFGEEFLPAVPALAILLVGVAFSGALFWVYPTLLAAGRADVPNYAIIASIVLQVALVVLLVPTRGYIGSAIVTTTVRVFQVATLCVYVLRNTARSRLPASL